MSDVDVATELVRAVAARLLDKPVIVWALRFQELGDELQLELYATQEVARAELRRTVLDRVGACHVQDKLDHARAQLVAAPDFWTDDYGFWVGITAEEVRRTGRS